MTPRFAHCWPELAAVAADLLAQREAKYPQAVAEGKLTQDAADRGIRIMRAIAEEWRLVATRAPLPDPLQDLGANGSEMTDELAAAATRAARIAASSPDDPHAADYAACVAALAWQQQPAAEGFASSRIAFVHAINTQLRARQAARRLAA